MAVTGRPRDPLDRRLVFVTGKGGVGKTTVAAGIAERASASGRRTLLCEVDGKGDAGACFEHAAVSFEPVPVQRDLWLMTMDTEAALREYLRIFLRLPLVARLGPLARAFDFVATAAPGVREILVVGKLCWEVRQRSYDLIVVDAAASGHIVSQLGAPQAINDLVRVGLVRQQTDWMLELLSEPATTGVVVVTTPEEMPVAETLELTAALRSETTVDVAAVVVNRVLPELFAAREEEVFEGLGRPAAVAHLAGALEADPVPLLDAARLAVTLRRTGAGHLERLRAALPGDIPTLYLPYLFAREQGRRATRRIADELAAELG